MTDDLHWPDSDTFNTVYYKQWSEISIHVSVVVK